MKDKVDNKEGFTIEMPKVGIIKGVLAKDIEVIGGKVVNLRTSARPYNNVFSVSQLRTIQKIMDEYGSGKVHLSPRHNLEIPEIRQKKLDEVLKELYIAGLFPGGAGTSVRNIFTCPDWCDKHLRPVFELGQMVSKNFGDEDMPNKVTISFAACANGCSRPHNSDIGIIARVRIEASDKKCPADCSACIEICKWQAMDKVNNRIVINKDCSHCGKCLEVCAEKNLSIKETGFEVLIGGKGGSTVEFAKQYANFKDDFEVLEIIEKVLSNYKKKAKFRKGSKKKKERLSEVIKRLSLSTFMK